MSRTETATNDSSTESPSRPSRRKRWVAAASCVSLVAAASGAGYWSNYVYMSDVSAQDAAAHFASLIADGQYDEAFSLTDGSNPVPHGGFFHRTADRSFPRRRTAGQRGQHASLTLNV